jgi:multisubunit Na+/H+ antiporter MnhB subunit
MTKDMTDRATPSEKAENNRSEQYVLAPRIAHFSRATTWSLLPIAVTVGFFITLGVSPAPGLAVIASAVFLACANHVICTFFIAVFDMANVVKSNRAKTDA